jgi:hypothetical protein
MFWPVQEKERHSTKVSEGTPAASSEGPAGE